MKYWEIIADRLHDAGWSLGWVSALLPPNQEAKVYYFSLAPAEVPLPLGWMLSNRAARAMNLQLNDEGKSIATPVETWNKIVRAQIIASLPPPVPVSVGSKRTASAR